LFGLEDEAVRMDGGGVGFGDVRRRSGRLTPTADAALVKLHALTELSMTLTHIPRNLLGRFYQWPAGTYAEIRLWW
jgi:hypothetical protein